MGAGRRKGATGQPGEAGPAGGLAQDSGQIDSHRALCPVFTHQHRRGVTRLIVRERCRVGSGSMGPGSPKRSRNRSVSFRRWFVLPLIEHRKSSKFCSCVGFNLCAMVGFPGIAAMHVPGRPGAGSGHCRCGSTARGSRCQAQQGTLNPSMPNAICPNIPKPRSLEWVIGIKRPNVHEEVQGWLRVERVVVGRDLRADERQVRIARYAGREGGGKDRVVGIDHLALGRL